MEALPELAPEIVPNILPKDEPLRRRRYERARNNTALIALTPTKVRLLRFLAECRFLSLPQLARLCCPNPRLDLSCKNARRQMRELFDAGLVDVLPVSRLALAEPDTPNDQTLLYGSAPNIYVPTLHGLTLLHQKGLIEKELLRRPQANYGPKNSLFLAHELAVRDVRVWLETVARHSGGRQQILVWKDGADAILESENGYAARPDAWFVYRVGENNGKEIVLVGMVEVDRGTERGDHRWREKLAAYDALFTGGGLRVATGYVNARILVIAPDIRRRDSLCLFITDHCKTLSSKFWLAEKSILNKPDLIAQCWRRPIGDLSYPLL